MLKFSEYAIKSMSNGFELRNYIYISSAKIESIYPQLALQAKEKNLHSRIIDKLKQIKELYLDLKFFSIKINPDFKTNDFEELIKKLNYIELYLNENKLVGTIDEPKSYFSNHIPTPMKWGPLPVHDDATVYFSGSTNDTIVGLGGSKKHLISMEKKEGPNASHLPLLANSIQEGQKIVMENRLSPRSGALQINDAVLAAVQEIDNNWKAPVSNLNFLAINYMRNKIQLDDEHRRKNVILGSPLYVFQT